MDAPKISLSEYHAMLANPEVSEEEILRYSTLRRGSSAFQPILMPDPARVEMSEDEFATESAMSLGNSFVRWRRQRRFRSRLRNENLPVLVSEGDSWFLFPFVINEVIDQLYDDYLIWSVGAAGDTAQNMVFGRPDYLKALREQKERVRAFLFSAAGNDIIGEDPETGRPVLQDLLRDFNGDVTDVAGHIDLGKLDEKLAFLKSAYETVIAKVRAEPGLEALPIVVHGYDYVFPYPWGGADTRDPVWAASDEWLGRPLEARGIMDQELRRNILKRLIDALYDMLDQLAGTSAETGVWVVDCRGAMPELGDWADEIHGTSDGFAKVAVRFRALLRNTLGIV